MGKNKTTTIILALATVTLWTTGFVFTKVAVRSLSPFSLTFIRFFSAAIFALILGFWKKVHLPKAKDIPLFLLLGSSGFALYQLFFAYAMFTLSAAISSLIIATVPVIVALFATLLFKEKIGKIGWVAIGLEFIGIMVLSLWKRDISIGNGLFWIILAVILFATYNLVQRFATNNYTPLQSTIYALVAAALLLTPFIPQTIKEVATAETVAILAAIFMGIFPSGLAFVFWNRALSMADQLTDVTNFMFLTPILTTILEIIVLKDLPDMGTVIGSIIILSGVLIFNNRELYNRTPL